MPYLRRAIQTHQMRAAAACCDRPAPMPIDLALTNCADCFTMDEICGERTCVATWATSATAVGWTCSKHQQVARHHNAAHHQPVPR